jgi:hypothetical protein
LTVRRDRALQLIGGRGRGQNSLAPRAPPPLPLSIRPMPIGAPRASDARPEDHRADWSSAIVRGAGL